MAFVLDASVTAVWALLDESSLVADVAERRLKDEFAVVPRLWWYEVRNLLIVCERRNRITAEETAHFLRVLSAYPIRIEETEDEKSILQLARKHQLSFYDASYLAVAVRHRIALASLDKPLRAAAMAVGVPLLG
jgi:predicted nucleic acid-binding protein